MSSRKAAEARSSLSFNRRSSLTCVFVGLDAFVTGPLFDPKHANQQIKGVYD